MVHYELSYTVEIENHKLNEITFDPIHINKGWDLDLNDYAFRNRSSYSEQIIADMFEQLSSKNLSYVNDKERITRGGFTATRFRILTDLIDESGEERLFRIIIDIFDSREPCNFLV
ncbi:MAG: hypothetical protein ACPGJV_16155, partial [Bacteriovoracaceae bacterium]